MIGHTPLPFSFDSDGEHQFELRISITQTSNLLAIEFCRQYVSKMLFKNPAKELKNTANAVCYGNMCSTKPYPFVSKTLSVQLTRFILMLKPTEFGKTYRKTNQRAFQAQPPLFLIDTQSNQD